MANIKIGSEWQNYGSVSVDGNTTAETTTDATPRKIANFDTEFDNGVAAASHANDQITVNDAGDYWIHFSLSFYGSSNSTFVVEVYKNGSPTGIKIERKLGTGGDIGSGGDAQPITLAASDVITLYHHSTDGGTAFTMKHGSLALFRLK